MTDAPTILSAFRYVHEVLKQIALLLQTSDQLLTERDWEGLIGNVCFDETSTHIQLTRRWIPHVAHRFYATDTAPRVLLFVSVLLDDRANEYEPMDECLLTAGVIVSKDEEWGDRWKAWWGRWHGFQRPRHDDGRLIVSESKDWGEQSDDAAIIERVITKGVPLPTVRSTDDLKGFLEPLLHAVEEYRRAPDRRARRGAHALTGPAAHFLDSIVHHPEARRVMGFGRRPRAAHIKESAVRGTRLHILWGRRPEQCRRVCARTTQRGSSRGVCEHRMVRIYLLPSTAPPPDPGHPPAPR